MFKKWYITSFKLDIYVLIFFNVYVSRLFQFFNSNICSSLSQLGNTPMISVHLIDVGCCLLSIQRCHNLLFDCQYFAKVDDETSRQQSENLKESDVVCGKKVLSGLLFLGLFFNSSCFQMLVKRICILL